MPYLIQILLPLRANDGSAFSRALYQDQAAELTERFGGVTAFTRSPGQGLWLDEDETSKHDDVIIYEVMADVLDRPWWTEYRRRLELQFRQNVLVMRAFRIERL